MEMRSGRREGRYEGLGAKGGNEAGMVVRKGVMWWVGDAWVGNVNGGVRFGGGAGKQRQIARRREEMNVVAMGE